jgi:hypothetical protein
MCEQCVEIDKKIEHYRFMRPASPISQCLTGSRI